MWVACAAVMPARSTARSRVSASSGMYHPDCDGFPSGKALASALRLVVGSIFLLVTAPVHLSTFCAGADTNSGHPGLDNSTATGTTLLYPGVSLSVPVQRLAASPASVVVSASLV